MPKENTIYKYDNNCINKESLNLINCDKNNLLKCQINNLNNKTLSNILLNNQYKAKSISIKKSNRNNNIKSYISESIINSISNKIKKESQNYISKRIYNIINSSGNKKKTLKLSTNNTSLKKYFDINKLYNKTLKHKVISSLDKNTFYSKDTIRSSTFNSNNSNNMIFIDRPSLNKNKTKYIYNSTTPNIIKKHISFREFINNNFSTINNTYNYQLFTNKIDINKEIIDFNSLKNKALKNSDNSLKNKYIFDINYINNKNLNDRSGLRNKKLVINTDNKKKILIVRKKESKINLSNYINKNIYSNNTIKKHSKIKDIGKNKGLNIKIFK